MFNQVVIVMDAKPTPRAEKHIEECVRENKCVCGCGRPMWKRGLARTCHYDFENELADLPDEHSRAAFIARLVRKGLVLLPQWIRKYRRKNVFSQIAGELKPH